MNAIDSHSIPTTGTFLKIEEYFLKILWQNINWRITLEQTRKPKENFWLIFIFLLKIDYFALLLSTLSKIQNFSK